MFETKNIYGKKYLFKPAESKRGNNEFFRADIQEAVYNLQKVINPQGAIPCFTKTINQTYGALQEKVKTSNDFDILNWQLCGGDIPQNILDGILREYVVDWASCNFDAHGGNFLVDNKGKVRCCDKEQSFRYLLDKESLKPDLDYNPNLRYGDIGPIYNTIFKRFISGELENVNFEIIYEALEKLDKISDEQYLECFKSYVEKLPVDDKDLYFEKILERKHNAGLYIRDFIKSVIQYKINDIETKVENEEEQSLSGKIVDNETLQVSNNIDSEKELDENHIISIPETQFNVETAPEIFEEIPLSVRSTNIIHDDSELKKSLAKYGITEEEWNGILEYKNSSYFLLSTLIHRVDLFKYSIPAFGTVFEADKYLDPKILLETYTKIYSAMCKFGKRYNRDIEIYRVGFKDFYDEIKASNQTESFLSFSKGYYKDDFYQNKQNIICSRGILERGAPCIDFSELEGSDCEEEILIPPFLNVNYFDNNVFVEGMYPEVEPHISKEGKPASINKEEVETLEKAVLDSTIPKEYYDHWYSTIRTTNMPTGDDEESLRLKNEFFKWQSDFKKILQFRFREIEKEINHPVLAPSDFLGWAIDKVKDKKGFKQRMQMVGDFFKKITKTTDEMDRE